MPRSKPHFKTFTTVRNHRKMPCYGDNDLFALWSRLGVEAIERFADRTADTFVLHEGELAGIAGVRSRGKAIKLLSKLTQTSPVSFTTSGRTLLIHFPNLASKHGFRHKNGTLRSPNANTDADADAGTPHIPPPRKRRSDKPAPRKPASEGASLFPADGLSDEQKRTLSGYDTLKDITPSQFQHACEVVMLWSHTRQKKRTDWPKVIRGAIVRGWGLEGYNGSGPGSGGRPTGRGSSNYTPPPKNTASFEALLAGPQTPEDAPGDELPLGAPTVPE